MPQVSVTMVKKRLENGDPCRKCVQAEDMLKSRGLWDRIDQVIWAVEGEPESEGMLLGERHGVQTAPFFLVQEPQGDPTIYESALRFMREALVEPAAAVAKSPAEQPSPELLADLGPRLAAQGPQAILRWGLEQFGERCAIAFSGAEDVALIDMAARTGLSYSVFCLDTGRLHPETYRFIDRVRSHYGIEIRMLAPERSDLEPFVRKKGLFSFYEDGHKECCQVRKVGPLRRALGDYRAWMTGQRRDQSPATRAEVPIVHVDPAFEGSHGSLVKLNPLGRFTSAQTWAYIRQHEVPFNELHDRGFISIGCEPCTRPVNPGQHEREGRWWWEESTQKECGLHSLPPASTGS